MISLVFNLASLLGLLNVLIALFCFYFTLVMILNEPKKKSPERKAFDIIQLFFVPVGMLLYGCIFIFQGWRLDPILLFGVFLLNIISIFLLIKDIAFNYMPK